MALFAKYFKINFIFHFDLNFKNIKNFIYYLKFILYILYFF
jgi:hypothetical protein